MSFVTHVLLLQEFMLCKAELKDPRLCFKEGKEVTKCGYRFFQAVKGSCADEFTSYWRCLDRALITRYF